MELSSAMEQAPKWGVFLFFFCHQFPQGSYYWAACEGNVQLRNKKQILFMSKMTDRNPRRLCMSHSSFSGADFVGRRQVISGHPANRFGSGCGSNTKLLHEVIDPISVLNDYLNIVFDDVVSLCGSCRKNALPWSPQEKLKTCCNSLPMCKKVFLASKEYAICRLPHQIETYSLELFEGL